MGRRLHRVRKTLHKQPHHTRRTVRHTTMRNRQRSRARRTHIRHRTTPHKPKQLRRMRKWIPLTKHFRHLRRHQRVRREPVLANMHQHTRKLHVLVLPGVRRRIPRRAVHRHRRVRHWNILLQRRLQQHRRILLVPMPPRMGRRHVQQQHRRVRRKPLPKRRHMHRRYQPIHMRLHKRMGRRTLHRKKQM